jgi:hypothetical protein
MTAHLLPFWAGSTTSVVVQRAQNDISRFWVGSSTHAVVQPTQNGWGRDGEATR